MLKSGSQREISLTRTIPDRRVVLYSDAEGNGNVAAVVIAGGSRLFMHGRIPHRVRQMLFSRKTNIVAYELLIAVAALVSFCPDLLKEASIEHFVDSTPAIACIVKGHSKKKDLSDIAGRLWFECNFLMSNYRVSYVRSPCNLADGPSRGDLSLFEPLGFQEVPFKLPAFKKSFDDWMQHPDEQDRLVV